MPLSNETGVFYVDIDSLIDTRLNILQSLDSELTKKLVESNQWQERRNFKVTGYPESFFREFYRTRNKGAIAVLSPTLVFDTLIEVMSAFTQDCKFREILVKRKLYVDVSRYDLKETDGKFIEDMISESLNGTVDVEVISYSIDMKWVRENNINTMFMYDGIYWLRKQGLKHRGLKYASPGTVLITPFDDFYFRDMETDTVSPEQAAEQFAVTVSESISLAFVNMEIFSIKIKIENAT